MLRPRSPRFYCPLQKKASSAQSLGTLASVCATHPRGQTRDANQIVFFSPRPVQGVSSRNLFRGAVAPPYEFSPFAPSAFSAPPSLRVGGRPSAATASIPAACRRQLNTLAPSGLITFLPLSLPSTDSGQAVFFVTPVVHLLFLRDQNCAVTYRFARRDARAKLQVNPQSSAGKSKISFHCPAGG